MKRIIFFDTTANDQDWRNHFDWALEGEPVEILYAENEASLRQFLASSPAPDAVLWDSFVQDQNTTGLLARLRQEGMTVPVVANDPGGDNDELMWAGATLCGIPNRHRTRNSFGALVVALRHLGIPTPPRLRDDYPEP